MLASLHTAFSQSLEVPVKVEVESGNLDNITLRLSKNGKESSMPATKNMKLKLDYNQSYILTFSKSGYITKTIEFNTTAPAERIKQGFEAYKIGIKLFRQQEDNEVVYNQPVGKIRYDQSLDDFNYETDYSKSILSAFSGDQPDKKKEEAKTKTASTETTPESGTIAVVAESNATISSAASVAVEVKNKEEIKTSPADNKNEPLPAGANDGQESIRTNSGEASRGNAAGSGGEDSPQGNKAAMGQDAPPQENTLTAEEKVTREELIEKNRIIIKVKVSTAVKDTHYSIVQYNWGGRYFFRGTTSITETLFTQWTGVRP